MLACVLLVMRLGRRLVYNRRTVMLVSMGVVGRQKLNHLLGLGGHRKHLYSRRGTRSPRPLWGDTVVHLLRGGLGQSRHGGSRPGSVDLVWVVMDHLDTGRSTLLHRHIAHRGPGGTSRHHLLGLPGPLQERDHL